MAIFGKSKKLPPQAAGTFLSAEEFPLYAPEVVQHIHDSIGRLSQAQKPIYLIFDVEAIGSMPEFRTWDLWSADSMEDAALPEYPHIMQWAWVLCDDQQETLIARNVLIKPEGFAVPAIAGKVHGITQQAALEKGVPIRAALKEFSECVAPTTRCCTFDACIGAAVVELEMRRAGLPMRFNRFFFYDLAERSRKFCALPDPDADELGDEPQRHFRKPKLSELYEKLFGPFDEIRWNDASADVQIAQHCLFGLKKREDF